jgi:hypothetical protein
MDSGSKFLGIATVIIVALILQVGLIVAERQEDLPAETAIAFAQAYYKLDTGMAQYLCAELTEDVDENLVNGYINNVLDEARDMGFKKDYMKTALSHIESETEIEDDNAAVVRIKAERRRYLNPVFGAIGKIFFLTESYPVELSLDLVQEDGKWKVCGEPFSAVEL